jgi:hypothetical protein
MLYGTLDGLIHGDLWRVVSVGAYFALCGAVAGAVVGGFVRLTDPEGAADFTNRSSPRRDAVFLRPSPLANPLIARWRFLEHLVPQDDSRASRCLGNPSLN